MSDALHIWTLYDHPLDYPDSCVAREWAIERGGARPTGLVLKADTLTPLRAEMDKRGLVCLGKDPNDDIAIVESWV